MPPIPGMRPPMGGAGHVVPAPKGSGTMGIIMPLYTIGIVIFFMYTMMKVNIRQYCSLYSCLIINYISNIAKKNLIYIFISNILIVYIIKLLFPNLIECRCLEYLNFPLLIMVMFHLKFFIGTTNIK